MTHPVHDLDAEVYAWARDQLEKSATEEIWLSINSTIAPVEGRPVAGFMILVWCRSPILGDPHLSTGNLIIGVPAEVDVREVARQSVAKLRDQKSAALRAPLPDSAPRMNGFRPNG